MFKKNVWALIFCFLINGIVDLFIYTFFTAYMLQISGNSITFISKFYIIVYLAIGLGFILLLPIVKRLNKTFVLQVGAILKAVFLLLIVLLGENLMQNYIWLGILYGFFEAIFWSGGYIIKNKIVESNKLKGLMATVNITSKIVSIVCPVVFGLSIDAWSFEKIAIVILGLMAVQIVVSFFIKQKEETGDKKASFKAFYEAVKQNPRKKIINKTFFVLFLRGLQCFFPTFLVYLIICSFGTNTSLGILTTIGSVLSIVSVLVFNAVKNADRKIWLYTLFAILESLSLVFAVIFLSKVFIIIFQMISVCVTIILNSTIEGIRGACIRDAGLERFLPEAIAIGEASLILGCVISFVGLLIVGICNTFIATIIIAGVFCVFIFLYSVMLGILKNDEQSFNENENAQIA